MADLVVPQLGESISEAVVAKWLKQVGDAVGDGEPIAELETDKITVQLPSPVAGALTEQRADMAMTRFAVLIDNVRSRQRIDYAYTSIDRDVDKDWFVFPWEAMAPKETLEEAAAEVPERLA